MLEGFDPSTIEDEGLRQVVIALMNLVESLSAKVAEQAEEIQRLRDEINRRVRRTRQAQDQGQQPGPGSVLAKRTARVQAPPQEQQTRQDQD